MTDAQFLQFVIIPSAGLVGGKINLERLTLAPLLTDQDDFFFDVLGVKIDSATGLIDDPSPPFLLYRSNANQVQDGWIRSRSRMHGMERALASMCSRQGRR